MTDEEFKFHVAGTLDRIASALERLAPAKITFDPNARKIDLGDLTQMSYSNRQRLEQKWHEQDEQKKFEPKGF